jgi:hypothetical protein
VLGLLQSSLEATAMTDAAPTSQAQAAPTLSAGKLVPLPPAERMRRSRARRRNGLRLLAVELRESEIEGLIRYGWLARADRADPAAILRALYAFLEDRLG